MRYIFLLVCFLIFQGVISQEKNQVRYGIKAGTNISHINFSKGSSPLQGSLPTNWQPGFVGGAVLIIPLRHSFYFQPEYLYSQMGGKFDDENRQFTIRYASFPVLLKWEFLNKFSLVAGPQFDLLISAKEKSENISSSLDSNIEHRSIFITGGLEYYFSQHFLFGVKYLQGLNHIDIQKEDKNLEFKYDVVQFSLAYLF